MSLILSWRSGHFNEIGQILFVIAKKNNKDKGVGKTGLDDNADSAPLNC